MKMYLLLFCLLLGIVCTTAEAGECEHIFTNSTGNITVDESTLTTESCTYIIWSNSSTNTLLNIKKLTLRDNDTLVIYDGNLKENRIIASYVAESKSGFQVAVGFKKNVTIIFTLGGKNTTSAWSLDFDTKECIVAVDNIWISRVESPLYVPTNSSSLNCTYIVKSDDLHSDYKAVSSLSRFEIIGNSSLTVSSNTKNITYKENSPLYDFFAADATNTFVVEINITNASIPQNFSMLVSAVAADCSGTVVLTNPYSWTHLPIQSVGYECRWLFHTNGSISSIIAHVSSLDVASGSDRLTFIRGGSSNGQILATVTANVKDYIVIDSTESMIVSLLVDHTDGQRSINLTLSETVYGSRLTGEGSLEFRNKTDNATLYYQLIASQGQVVNVEVLSDIPENSSVTFYNGLQLSDSKLAVLRHGAQNLKNVIGGFNMLVELSDFKSGSNFNASFTSIQPDCNMLVTSSFGQIFHSKQSEEVCTLTIAPQDVEGTIIMNIDFLRLGEKESVEVYSGLDHITHLAHFVGPLNQMNSLQMYVLVRDSISIVVTRAAASSTANVIMHYQTVSEEMCGRNLNVPTDNILTPNYPNQYPLNAHCIWFPGNLTNQFLFLSFQDLALAQNHTFSVVDTTNQTSHQVLASYGGIRESSDQLPADLVFDLPSIQIEFQSSQGIINQVGRGVNISSRVMECGGTFRGNGTFHTTDYPKPLTKSSYCVWIIDVKEDNATNIVNFTIKAIEPNVIDQYLTIYDGNSVRAKLLSKNLTEKGDLLSYYDTLVVVLNYTQETSVLKAGIHFSFTTKNCHADELCDNGVCLHADWRCNGFDDCGDNTDERNCFHPNTTTPSPTTPPSAEGHSGWVKSGWIPACLFIGVLLGAILVFAVPKIIRRLRTRGGNYSRMGDNTANA